MGMSAGIVINHTEVWEKEVPSRRVTCRCLDWDTVPSWEQTAGCEV